MDTNVLVALFTEDALNARADASIAHSRDVLIVSDFVEAEFASVIARKVRVGQITRKQARDFFFEFDLWIEREAQREQIAPSDVAAAGMFITFGCRNPIARRAYIAVVRRIGAVLITLTIRWRRLLEKPGSQFTTADRFSSSLPGGDREASRRPRTQLNG